MDGVDHYGAGATVRREERKRGGARVMPGSPAISYNSGELACTNSYQNLSGASPLKAGKVWLREDEGMRGREEERE